MKLRYKILSGFFIFFAISLASLAFVLSYTSECGSKSIATNLVHPVKAIIYDCYGSSEILRLENIEKPIPADNEVLVKIQAASVNPLDWHYMRGAPYIMRLGSGIGAPTDPKMGVDFSGTVETVGKNVNKFKPGDQVFGTRGGAFAEYVTIPEDRGIVIKPANINFEQAASVGIAGVTALQALRDLGQVQAGQKVLINGASGGVGTFAVQVAKSFGAEVTGVCSDRNLELVRSIGADHVLDYRKQDYSQLTQKYDLIIDMVGNHSPLTNSQVLNPNGKLVVVGGAKGNWIAPLMGPIKALLTSPFVSQEMAILFAEIKQADLIVLSQLMQQGKVVPVIDRRYLLSEVAQAIDYLEKGHARGKVVINTN